VYELFSCRFGRFRLHTSLRLRALIRSWQGVYVCKFRSTRTRFQFKKTLPGEHSPENFCCVGPHFQAFMNLADVFSLRCFSEARKKHFRRNFRKCSRMRPNEVVPREWLLYSSTGFVYCHACKLLSPQTQQHAFISGFSDWKHSEDRGS